MRFTAAVPLLAGSLLLATAAPSTAVPNQIGGLGGVLVGGGVALGAYDYPIEANKEITVERYLLQPGEIIRWGNKPSTVVVIPKGGDLVNYPACDLQYPMANGQANWLPRSQYAYSLEGVTANGQARLHSADGDPHLLVNNGTETAEFFAVIFSIPNPYPVFLPDTVPAPPPGDCPESLLD